MITAMGARGAPVADRPSGHVWVATGAAWCRAADALRWWRALATIAGQALLDAGTESLLKLRRRGRGRNRART